MPLNTEENIKSKNAFSLYELFIHALAQKPFPRAHEIYSFGRPFLGLHYYILSLPDLCPGVEVKIIKEIMHFHYMTYLATP